MNIDWVDGAELRVSIDADGAVLSANREGLLSLANHLSALAQEEPGSHFHLDQYNSLEEGSEELVFVKTQ